MRFSILGPLEVRSDEGALRLGGLKPRAVMAMLLLQANEAVGAERLAWGLWGEDAPAGAVQTVQVHVSRLRRALSEPELVATTPSGYRLRVWPGELDVDRFEQRVAEARRTLADGHPDRAGAVVREALALYRGPPLAEFVALPFAAPEIMRLEEQRLEAVELRVQADLDTGRHSELVGELQRLVGEHPWRERLHGQLMLALYRSGRQADALDAFRQARELLVEQLGIEPGSDLRNLHDAILRQAREIEAPRPDAVRAPRVVLPRLSGTTFGRRNEHDVLLALLRRDDVRLVTLVGPGGIGKTRVALEVARAFADEVRHDARFVDLAATAEPAQVPDAVAHALSIAAEGSETSEQALARVLAHKDLLLVLDNFEHLMPAAPLVSYLQDACPGLRVLATSREPLRLRAERVHVLAPLTAADAAALFRDRAQLPADEPDGEAVQQAIEQLCARLDGLPLAIELAAARTSVLSPQTLLSRLTERLDAFGPGPRDAPTRQRTVRATMQWSHDLLDDTERSAFASLAVFAGGATAKAAETVTGASLDVLASLATKSLVVRRGERLTMLETVREFAAECLERLPQANTVRARHLAHYLVLAERAEHELLRAARAQWLGRLDAEIDNLRAAFAWATAEGDAERALRLGSALAEFWLTHNLQQEGQRWLDVGLAIAEEPLPLALRAKALTARAYLRAAAGTADAATRRAGAADAEQALEFHRSVGDAGGEARCLTLLSELAGGRAEWERARTLAAAAVAAARAAGDDIEAGRAMSAAAGAAKTLADARSLVQQASKRLREAGDQRDLSVMLSRMAFFAISHEQYAEASALLTEAMAAAQEVAVPYPIAVIRGNQGLAALFQVDLDDATNAFANQLELCAEHIFTRLAPEALGGLAAVWARRGSTERAARLYGAATALGFAAEGADTRVYQRLIDRFITPARATCDPTVWTINQSQGARLTVMQAINCALDTPRVPAAHQRTSAL